MILFVYLQFQICLDSLKTMIESTHNIQYIISLNHECRRLGLFDTANHYLRRYENLLGVEEQAFLNYLIGDNLFFEGALLKAREQYLKTVARFSNTRYANEALDRLHLFESARKDTSFLKRLARSIYLYEIKEFERAEDSLIALIKSPVGDYALFYLALLYYQRNELEKALSALEQLYIDFPANRLYQAKLILSEIYFATGKEKEAVNLLEKIIISRPNSPSAIRAREILKNKNNP